MNDNAARVIQPDEPAPVEKPKAVISSTTRTAAGLMLAALVALVTLDSLASSGRLAGASDAVMAALSLVPLAMAALILPVARSFGDGGTIRRQWMLFGTGMLSVGIGNIIYIVLYITTGKDPYPSYADFLTLGMYGIFSVAFFLAVRSYRELLDLRTPALIAGAFSLAMATLVYFTVLGPYVVFAPNGSQAPITRILNTVYPMLDVFVILAPAVMLGLLVSKLGAGRVAWPWWLVVAGSIVLAVTDTVFAYAGYIGAGRSPFIDAGYALAPMLLGLAVLVARDVYHS